jgi:hypothetical protein
MSRVEPENGKCLMTQAEGRPRLVPHDGARALYLYSEVMAMQLSRILGPDHPGKTLCTKANLAATMSRQGGYEEAK